MVDKSLLDSTAYNRNHQVVFQSILESNTVIPKHYSHRYYHILTLPFPYCYRDVLNVTAATATELGLPSSKFESLSQSHYH